MFAFFLFVLSVWRAATLSVTIDEAYSYTQYASAGFGGIFLSGFDANNHVLHSTLMWLSTALFGVHELSLRLPALAGSALFLWVLPALIERVVAGHWLQKLTFLILTVNPLTLDLLCAGRGYSMAAGLLAAALVALLQFSAHQRPGDLVRMSLALGLSCCANLSFAFISIAVLCVASALTAWRGRWRLLTQVWIPGALLTAFVLILPLSRALPGSFYWGAKTIRESVETTSTAFLQHNPQYAGPVFTGRTRARMERRFLPGALALIAFLCVYWFLQGRNPEQMLLAAILVLHLTGYWIAHTWLQVPYPSERTGLATVLLFFLVLASAVPFLFRSGLAAGVMLASPTVLVLLAILVQLAAQFDPSYFWAWHEERDNRQIVQLLRDRGVRRISCYWLFRPALEFYRLAGRLPPGAEPIPRINGEYTPLTGYEAYVLKSPPIQPSDLAGLDVVWKNDVTGVTIALAKP